MGSHRLTQEAKADLKPIYMRGFIEHGEVQADKYYSNFFDYFEQLAEQPLLNQAVDFIHPGYRRSVCGVDSIYYRVNGEPLKSWLL